MCRGGAARPRRDGDGACGEARTFKKAVPRPHQGDLGDFDARMWTVSRDVSKGGVFAKLGLMARESCHADARADYVLARNQAGPVPGGGVRFAHRNESRSACCWEETYQVYE